MVFIRPLLIVTLLGVVGFLTWRNATRREAYTGGDVQTTGTIEAVHVRLGFKISGRIAEISASEGATVAAGQVVASLETQDLDVQLQTARASLELARAALVQARAARERTSRDLEQMHALLTKGIATAHDVDVARTNDESATGQVQGRASRARGGAGIGGDPPAG
jgi:multidrug efflux pump subunit AcrA (membrane-fusion protein)